MAKKAILQIKDTELRARALIEGAREEAEEILARAGRERDQAISQISAVCREDAALKKEQAKFDAEKESLEFAAETERLCWELEARLLSRKDAAVKAIVEAARN